MKYRTPVSLDLLLARRDVQHCGIAPAHEEPLEHNEIRRTILRAGFLLGLFVLIETILVAVVLSIFAIAMWCFQ